jgi:hypothetical protein
MNPLTSTMRNTAPARANVPENQGFFQRPQETVLTRDWVVADAVLIEPVCPEIPV